MPTSVVIPMYNRAETVARATRRVWAQRAGQPAEILVVDDHSTYGSGDTLPIWGPGSFDIPRTGAQRRHAIPPCCSLTQRWLGKLDSDDEWMPDHRRTQWPLRHGHVLRDGREPVSLRSRSRSRSCPST